MSRPGALWGGVAVLVVIAVAVLWLSSGGASPPFEVSSSTPDGYRAVSILLRDAGSEVDSISGADLESLTPQPRGRSVVVPIAQRLTASQLDRLESYASEGATVVLAGGDSFVVIDDKTLTRTPAQPVGAGLCTIPELEGLVALDHLGFGAVEIAADSGDGTGYCFTEQLGFDGAEALVSERRLGAGRIVELASPYLWANARLQPDKEQGGQPLDNGPMAVALLGGSPVTFVDAVPSPDASPDGTRNPLALMPFNVKLALVQAGGAFLIYAWWRGRRLGRPVREEMPVEVAGSELVEAVGGLLRRNGSVARSAQALRERQCRELASALGIPREAGPEALVAAVAARSGRGPEVVRAVLFGGDPPDAEGLVALSRDLDELRSEVLDVRYAT